MTIASLAMYPFDHLRPAYDHFWDAVRGRLSFDAPALDWDIDPSRHVAATTSCSVRRAVGRWSPSWLRPSCRRHLRLRDRRGPRRHLLLRDRQQLRRSTRRRSWPVPDLVVVANAPDSLSGWISLRVATAARRSSYRRCGVDRFARGQHRRAFVTAVPISRRSTASRGRTSAPTRLHVVGRGPRIPCLPLVTSRSTTDATLARTALGTRATRCTIRRWPTCARRLKIRDFLVRDLADYEGLSGLAELW